MIQSVLIAALAWQLIVPNAFGQSRSAVTQPVSSTQAHPNLSMAAGCFPRGPEFPLSADWRDAQNHRQAGRHRLHRVRRPVHLAAVDSGTDPDINANR